MKSASVPLWIYASTACAFLIRIVLFPVEPIQGQDASSQIPAQDVIESIAGELSRARDILLQYEVERRTSPECSATMVIYVRKAIAVRKALGRVEDGAINRLEQIANDYLNRKESKNQLSHWRAWLLQDGKFRIDDIDNKETLVFDGSLWYDCDFRRVPATVEIRPNPLIVRGSGVAPLENYFNAIGLLVYGVPLNVFLSECLTAKGCQVRLDRTGGNEGYIFVDAVYPRPFTIYGTPVSLLPHISIWLNGSKHFSPARYEWRVNPARTGISGQPGQTTQLIWRTECAEAENVGSDVWLPKQATLTTYICYVNAQENVQPENWGDAYVPEYEYHFRVSSAKVNQGLSWKDVMPRFERGTNLLDKMTGKVFVVGDVSGVIEDLARQLREEKLKGR